MPIAELLHRAQMLLVLPDQTNREHVYVCLDIYRLNAIVPEKKLKHVAATSVERQVLASLFNHYFAWQWLQEHKHEYQSCLILEDCISFNQYFYDRAVDCFQHLQHFDGYDVCYLYRTNILHREEFILGTRYDPLLYSPMDVGSDGHKAYFVSQHFVPFLLYKFDSNNDPATWLNQTHLRYAVQTVVLSVVPPQFFVTTKNV